MTIFLTFTLSFPSSLLYSRPVDGGNASRRAFSPRRVTKPKQEVELKFKLRYFYGNNETYLYNVVLRVDTYDILHIDTYLFNLSVTPSLANVGR